VTAVLNAAAPAILILLAAALTVHCARQSRHRKRYSVAELGDPDRTGIDWPQVRDTMPGCQEGHQS